MPPGPLTYATRVRSLLQLRELTVGEFLASLDDLTEIYAAAMNAPAQQLPGRRAIMERHAHLASFRALVALRYPGEEGWAPGRRQAQPVGFAYGFHGEAGQWWHDQVRDALRRQHGRAGADAWMGDSFEIAEVHVHPGHQGRGTGRQMMLSLTAARLERTALLSTMDANTRARRLYRALGFADLLAGFIFPGAEIPYVIMGSALPLRG